MPHRSGQRKKKTEKLFSHIDRWDLCPRANLGIPNKMPLRGSGVAMSPKRFSGRFQIHSVVNPRSIFTFSMVKLSQTSP
jgi:hypothetical protein